MQNNFLQSIGFHPATERWFSQRFSAASPPQQQGWPEIARGKHTLILAPTGSGKTLAAFLWCIDALFRLGLETEPKDFAHNSSGIHTLYISPLKALNNDIHYNLQEPLNGIKQAALELGIDPPNIRTAVRTGDTPSHVRQSMVKKPPHILITTPESLYLLLTSERGRLIFQNIRYIIVDEIHALSNNKRGVHLGLSLERLLALVFHEPVRIGLSATQKPLSRIAAFLGGSTFDPKSGRHTPRSVSIVDAGQRKDMHVQVVSPVHDWSDLPDASVWPQVIEKLYELITSHRTTLVFVNARAQSEKIARQLNERHRSETGNPDAELALAHHGSISREMRYDIEARLKRGMVPAVVATASLELGIDVGSIDLVVQLQSPTSVSSALQRIGRSGHLLDSTSKGIVIPLFQADLDDCAALTQAMLDRDIEETHIPENALDVLAQQIVAEVAMRSWPRLALLQLVRNSYCYRHLSETAFNNVLDMLSGRFENSELRALQPRLAWDKVNDELLARRGSRLLSVINGGTIADRGYYGVHLEGSNTRLGEVEEEFVFESKVGDIFFLGNNEWRIHEITRDRILVTPRGSTKLRAPFWKAEPLYRDMATSLKIGQFRRTVLERPDDLALDSAFDQATQTTLRYYLQHQQEKAGVVATDRQFVVEYFRDSVGEPHIVLHAPLGGRVIGAWATALAQAMEKRFGSQIQFTYDDDGMLFRLLDTEEMPPFQTLMHLPFETLKHFIVDTLDQTPMFIVRFRHNATRALLLQRSRIGKRIPLWLQRLRAADLLQVVKQFAEFPILLETYRDCLQDLFDIPSLKKVIEQIHNESIQIHYVQTPSPSPMTSGLMFRFLSEQMYDYDRFRTVGHAAEISSELLADILSREDIPTIITESMVEQAEQHWQFLSPERQARDMEDLFEIIDKVGPIGSEELQKRSRHDIQEWMDQLKQDGRIVRHDLLNGWINVQKSDWYDSDRYFNERLQQTLRTAGPVSVEQLHQRTRISADSLNALLESMCQNRDVVRGKLVVGRNEELWCDRENFSLLYRQAIVQRRKSHEPIERDLFYKFLFSWHKISQQENSLLNVMETYLGVNFPIYNFERDVVPARLLLTPEQTWHELDERISAGEIITVASQDVAGGRYVIQFLPRGKGHVLFTKEELQEKRAELSEQEINLVDFLKENGASPHRDICAATELLPSQIDDMLSKLSKLGLVSCDHYASFLSILQSEPQLAAPTKQNDWHAQIKQPWSTPHGSRRSLTPKRKVRERLKQRHGRWFLTTSFAVMGKTVSQEKRIELQSRLLLERYGVLVKEFYRRERDLLPWYVLFRHLKKMEWSGEIRHGYFITGLSGIQFATDAAVQKLETVHDEKDTTSTLLSTIDPALPFGGHIDWDLKDKQGKAVSVVRGAQNHIYFYQTRPVAYLINFASSIELLKAADESWLRDLPEHLKTWQRAPEPIRARKKIDISQIDGHPAAESPFAHLFVEHGFEIDGDHLVLWPSNI